MVAKILQKFKEIGAIIRSSKTVSFLLDGTEITIVVDRIKLGIGAVVFLLTAWLLSVV